MMRAFVILACALLAQASPAPARGPRPTLADYPVKEIFRGAPAPVLLTTPEARRLRTELQRQGSRPPDFAGHYKLAMIGCGSTCRYGAIIDARTGQVWLPGIQTYMIHRAGELAEVDSEFSIESELLILSGFVNEKYTGRAYYRWHGNKLTLLRVDEYSNAQLALNAELYRSLGLWYSKDPKAYEFTLDLRAPVLSISTPRTFRVVKSDVVTHRSDAYDGYDSIDELFTLLLDAQRLVPDRMSVTFDKDFGYPLGADVDLDGTPAGRLSFRITSFKAAAK